MKSAHFIMVTALASNVCVLGACSSSSSSSPAAPANDGGGTGATLTVLVEGPLAQPGSQAQMTHDAIFGGYRAQAQNLGNVGHAAFLDVATSQKFLAVDTWDSMSGLQQFLSDPSVLKSDMQLFATAPKATVTVARAGWYGWGTFSRTLADGSPAYVALIRGTLATDPQSAMTMHNQGAMQAQPMVASAGDVAHLPLDSGDAQGFLVIDIWTNPQAPQSVYSAPAFQQAFASLLAGPPTITVYGDTNWVQW